MLINVSICLSDIPKECIKESKANGKKYLDIVVADRREPDKFDNDTTVYISQSKQEREDGEEKIYIGSGKKVVFKEEAKETKSGKAGKATGKAGKATPPEAVDDLPF